MANDAKKISVEKKRRKYIGRILSENLTKLAQQSELHVAVANSRKHRQRTITLQSRLEFLTHSAYVWNLIVVLCWLNTWRYNIGLWQSDSRTDGRTDRSTATANTALVQRRAVKTINLLMQNRQRNINVQYFTHRHCSGAYISQTATRFWEH